jgi:hypothetical protein
MILPHRERDGCVDLPRGQCRPVGVDVTGAVRDEAFFYSPTGDYVYEVPYFGFGSQFGKLLRVKLLNNFNGRVRFPS